MMERKSYGQREDYMYQDKYILLLEEKGKNWDSWDSLEISLNEYLESLEMSEFTLVRFTNMLEAFSFVEMNSSKIAAYILDESVGQLLYFWEDPKPAKNAAQLFLHTIPVLFTPDAKVVLLTNNPDAYDDLLSQFGSNRLLFLPKEFHIQEKAQAAFLYTIRALSNIANDCFDEVELTHVPTEIKLLHFIKHGDCNDIPQDNDGDLYEACAKSIELIYPSWEEIRRYLIRHPHFMHQMSPRKFEELAAEIFRSHGFDVELTTSTRDGGYDVVAYLRNEPSDIKILIEAKRFHPDRLVGPGIVRALYGTKQRDNASQVVLVTSSYVSPTAKKEYARFIPYELDLYERDRIIEWCKACGAVELGGDLDGNIEPGK
jgi:hypothetical protein